jgi:hypothetical protein
MIKTKLKTMVEKVKRRILHPRDADVFCFWHGGNVGARPIFSIWAEFWLILCCDHQSDRKYLIENIIEMKLKNNSTKGEEK